jgi:hypothetical protein
MYPTGDTGRACCLALLLNIAAYSQTPIVRTDFGDIPLHFEENRGQADPAALYLARGHNFDLSLTRAGVNFSAPDDVVEMRIIGANEDALINAEEPLEGVSNYFVGSRFMNGVRHYAGVRVHGILPGVDIVYHASKHDLEYDFVVHPGANPASLRLRFEGRRPQLDESGNISVRTTSGELKQRKPRVWQQTEDRLQEIDCRLEQW